MGDSLYRAKEDFLKYLDGLRGYSPLTLRSYNDAIDEMLRGSEITESEGVISINLMPVRLKIAHLSAKSIALKLSAMRSFIRYVSKQGSSVVLYGDQNIKIPKTLPKPIPHSHILSALEHAEPLAKLAITLLYSMGLRISELTHLEIDAITDQWCRVRGKGNKERDIPMIPEVYQMICNYECGEKYIFESKGEKLSENSLRYSITKAFAAVGLKVTPHQLRHSYATELLNHGARIADVSQLLGHSSMAATQIYTKLGNALKMDHYLQSHPLCQHNEDVT